MEDWYDYYVGLYAIGSHYFGTLPANLRAWITGYGAGGWFSLGPVTAAVLAPGVLAPGATPAPLAAGYNANGAVAAHPPAALGGVPDDGTREARKVVGGACHSTASPYIHSVAPAGVPVVYTDNAPSITDFLEAWDRLVQLASVATPFTWPGSFATAAHRLQFLAAAFAESSRDRCQLGAIQTALWQRDAGVLPARAFTAYLPMCAGGTYVPQVVTHTATAHCLTASPTTWGRAKGVSKGPVNINAVTEVAAIQHVKARSAATGARALTTEVKYPEQTPWHMMTDYKAYLKS
ncbi:MAG TPA: hypothetical protein VI299_10260 [Polyangiales bacterium]